MERRSTSRVRTVLKAEIRYNDGMMSTPCIVRDLSEHGARLELPGEMALPDRFDLHIEKKQRTYRALVKRHHGTEIGVAFLEAAISPTEPEADLLERVMRLETEVAETREMLSKLAAVLKAST